MKIIALERELPVDTPSSPALLREEAARVWELYLSGILREIHFRADSPLAVLVLECPGPEIAQEAINSLPLVRKGRIAFDIVPLAPYPGLARLFDSQHPAQEAGKETAG